MKAADSFSNAAKMENRVSSGRLGNENPRKNLRNSVQRFVLASVASRSKKVSMHGEIVTRKSSICSWYELQPVIHSILRRETLHRPFASVYNGLAAFPNEVLTRSD